MSSNDRRRRRVRVGLDDETRAFIAKTRAVATLIGRCVRYGIELWDALHR